jgi:hypothetical protein
MINANAIQLLMRIRAEGMLVQETERILWSTTAIKELVAYELVTVEDGINAEYRLTERGAVYSDALLAVPLPVKKWVMP